jgi:hypothetical protein
MFQPGDIRLVNSRPRGGVGLRDARRTPEVPKRGPKISRDHNPKIALAVYVHGDIVPELCLQRHKTRRYASLVVLRYCAGTRTKGAEMPLQRTTGKRSSTGLRLEKRSCSCHHGLSTRSAQRNTNSEARRYLQRGAEPQGTNREDDK